jgi:hypothetical protein
VRRDDEDKLNAVLYFLIACGIIGLIVIAVEESADMDRRCKAAGGLLVGSKCIDAKVMDI